MIDVRTDTITKPTQKMLDAMYHAQVGDDILGEDPTVKELEGLAASIFKKEAAMLTVSGTMANQLAVMALARRGEEVIVGSRSHIYNLEVGALATLSQVQARPLEYKNGIPDPVCLQQAIQKPGIQNARTGLICLENTYDLNRGIPITAQQMEDVISLGGYHGIPVYLDGARIYNAAYALDTPVDQLVAPVDAFQFCLTKGLCAPFGSLLLGDGTFVEQARWLRQRIGGGMRQAGYMAAAGIVALEDMPEQIRIDNQNARTLAASIAENNCQLVEPEAVRSNILHLDATRAEVSPEAFWNEMRARGVLMKAVDSGCFRMVCHRGIGEAEIQKIAMAVASSITYLRSMR